VPARMTYLSDEDKAAIYEAALEVMATVGQRVHHPEALALLRAAGAEVVEPDLVKVPRELVESARHTAPAVIDVFDRAGAPAMSLGRTATYFGSGSAVTNVYDLQSGKRRPTTLADGAMAARLCDALPHIDFVMAYAHPGETDPHVALLESFRAMALNTTKPLVVVAENADDLAVMCDIAGVLRGGADELAAKPYFTLYGEPTSALRHPVEAVDKLLLCADRGIPCVYSTSPLAGGTAPITVAGHIAQGAAESLLGLVMHQLRKPGAPFLFGVGPAVLDMGTMQSSYNAPEYLMGYICAVELAKWLDLPNWGYAGTTDAQLIDAQAGMEAAELTLLSLATGSNLNHDIGYLDFGMTGSLELIVLTDEYLAMNRKLFAGVEVTPETLAVDVIREVGPGGDFLSHRATAKQVRKAQWRPTILNRQGHARWLEEGALDLQEKARQKALRLLAEHQPPSLPAETTMRIDALVAGFNPAAAESERPQEAIGETGGGAGGSVAGGGAGRSTA
jgi:trimethylamine--corrinoid protein Co-methyltransferase